MWQKFKVTLATLSFVFVAFGGVSSAYAQNKSDCGLVESQLVAMELELDSIEADYGGQVDKCTRKLAAAEAIAAELRVSVYDYEKALGEERERRFRAEARTPGWKWALGGAAVGSVATVVVYALIRGLVARSGGS